MKESKARLTGIIRRLDPLGRIVIPKEMRSILELGTGDFLEILQEDSNIIMKKYQTRCVFCGQSNELFDYKGIRFCKQCKDNISKEAVNGYNL